ncbi:hypothetical protein [Leifsonia sp. 1010]|uniref:hypothetical protein n=1 Tax=Leifsonia sp. 1010 TaxID=2817769 RepID=UPI002861A3C4|nr:hypothetical protein [Leifsonia sp. 1010]MDR6610624.1 hypothetical protein [Leifsonia sp. 1010]
MSDTPDAPKRATYEPGPDDARPESEQAAAEQAGAAATAPAASAAAEPATDTGAQVVEPPSNPVSARGHLNRPAGDAEQEAAPVAAAPAEPQRPAAIAEPEPVVASDDDVAAAIARNSPQPGATAAGDATVDTASPVESATPVIVAAEAATLSQGDTATTAYGSVPPGAAAATAAAPAPQPVAPIYLTRPEPPKKKSNRGVGILIALVGTVAFAVLWAGAVLIVGSLLTPSNEFGPALLEFFTGGRAFGIRGWAPVVAFFIGMVVLIQILNRARWWAYILGGLFVAVFVYFVYIGAGLIDAQYWLRNSEEFAILMRSAWVSPLAVLAGVIAREVSIWTGAWLAARGRKLKARNAEAQADYEQQVADAQNQAVAAYAQQGY